MNEITMKWIPVKEQLPKDLGKLIVTNSYGVVGVLDFSDIPVDYVQRYGGKEKVIETIFKGYSVIAWMEFPEAYKEEN